MYEPSTAGQPNGLEKVFGDGVLTPTDIVYETTFDGPGGIGIATGELYDLADDPHQWRQPVGRARRQIAAR